ncbi:tachylectin-related carbohydrate-binding protein [Streptomyces sp. NPDC057638]|uniref:tachylectin-related carbohydrate-binding protein n=1 Tax=Streptomyces sp. NPDC057638 TaxID=3346190 RepID=UPI003689F782
MTNAPGDLLQYTMDGPLAGSTFSGYQKAGAGWGSFGKVLAGPRGEFLAFKSTGTYYAHRTESGTWNVGLKKISDHLGWLGNAADREQATIDRTGHLWVADNLGQLYAYTYDPDLGPTGGLRSLGTLDTGWDRYDLITAGDAGVLFGRHTDGRLFRSRYDVRSQRWIERHVLVGEAAWGNFKTFTAGGGDTLVAVRTNGEALYYRYDERTDTWPVAAKPVAAGGWHAFDNVTSRPDNCRLLSDHTPAAPQVPTAQNSRTTVFASSAGKLEFAYTNNTGLLSHGRADMADLDSVRWTQLNEGNTFAGQPAITEQRDGRVTILAQRVDGSVLQRDQSAPNGPTWSGWNDLAGAMAARVVSGTMPTTGLIAQFAVDDGRPWYRIQARENGPFLGWKRLPGSSIDGALTAVPLSSGIHLTAKKKDGTLATALFSPNRTLSDWSPVGTQTVTGNPAIVRYSGDLIRIFATSGDGVVTTAQTRPEEPFGAWRTIPAATEPLPDGPATLEVKGSPTGLQSPVTGQIQVVVRGADSRYYVTGETRAGSDQWRPWRRASAFAGVTSPTAFVYRPSGAAWAFVYRDLNDVSYLAQVNETPGGAGGAPTFSRPVRLG